MASLSALALLITPHFDEDNAVYGINIKLSLLPPQVQPGVPILEFPPVVKSLSFEHGLDVQDEQGPISGRFEHRGIGR